MEIGPIPSSQKHETQNSLKSNPRQNYLCIRIAVIWATFVRCIKALCARLLGCLASCFVYRQSVVQLQNRVLSFLDGEPDDQGRTFDKILGRINSEAGRKELEGDHCWVQQVFPNVEKSKFHPKPEEWVVTPEIVAALKTPDRREKICKAFHMALRFYGLDSAFKNNDEIDGMDLGKLHWLKRGDHNHWRITRIIHALKLAGLDKEAKKFVELLSKVYEKVPEKIGPESLEFWKKAALEHV